MNESIVIHKAQNPRLQFYHPKTKTMTMSDSSALAVNVSIDLLQNGADTLRKQLSSHWTAIGDIAFTELETPVSHLSAVHAYLLCGWCLTGETGKSDEGKLLENKKNVGEICFWFCCDCEYLRGVLWRQRHGNIEVSMFHRLEKTSK